MFLGVTASSRGLVVATWAGGGHIPLPGGGGGGRTGAPCQKRTPERQQAGAASFQALPTLLLEQLLLIHKLILEDPVILSSFSTLFREGQTRPPASPAKIPGRQEQGCAWRGSQEPPGAARGQPGPGDARGAVSTPEGERSQDFQYGWNTTFNSLQ